MRFPFFLFSEDAFICENSFNSMVKYGIINCLYREDVKEQMRCGKYLFDLSLKRTYNFFKSDLINLDVFVKFSYMTIISCIELRVTLNY